MKIRTWLTLLLLPLFVAHSAHAIFGIPDVAAMAQRVTIIANQGAQIANQIAQLATLNGQLGKLTEQFEHIKDSTLGQKWERSPNRSPIWPLSPASSSAPACPGNRTLPARPGNSPTR